MDVNVVAALLGGPTNILIVTGGFNEQRAATGLAALSCHSRVAKVAWSALGECVRVRR